jgi:excisionase family DNA binding protein
MISSEKLLSVGEAAVLLGVSVVTIRRWEKQGKIEKSSRTLGDHRRFSLFKLQNNQDKGEKINICYARVSSHDQKKDLETQAEYLSNYCAERGIQHEVIKDLGSGLNFKKKGLNRLLDLILLGKIGTIYVSNKDRLLRFGSELMVRIAQRCGATIVFLEDNKVNFEQTLAKDVLEIITVFSARLYGARSHKKKRENIAKLSA